MSSTLPELEVARAGRLNTALRLDQIFLFSIHAQHLGGAVAPKFGFSLEFEPTVWSPLPDGLVAMFPLKVSLEDRSRGAATKLAEIRVGMRIFYKTEAEGGLEEHADCIEDYLGIVGWMHAWPYARAEVQDVSVRMGFPPLVLPVLLAGQTAGVIVRKLADPERASAAGSKARTPKPKKAKRR